MDAVRLGADVRTWTKVVGFRRDEAGRLTGVRVRDQLSGVESDIDARVIINATGPWADATRGLGHAHKPMLRPLE